MIMTMMMEASLDQATMTTIITVTSALVDAMATPTVSGGSANATTDLRSGLGNVYEVVLFTPNDHRLLILLHPVQITEVVRQLT